MKLTEKQLKTLVIDLFRNNPTSLMNHNQVRSKLGLPADKKTLIPLLDKLVADGKLGELEKGRYHWLNPVHAISGIISFTASGNAFVIPENAGMEDIFIDQQYVLNALDGDRVMVRVFNKKKKNKRQEGEVIEVIERKRSEISGILEFREGKLFLLPENRKINVIFHVDDGKTWRKEVGNKAIGRLLEWIDPDDMPQVEIIKILGEPGSNDAEMHSIAADAGFMEDFPPEVEKDADKISYSIPAAEIKKREDFREVTTFTIDPVDAKDFDDALSFKKLEEDLFEIGVHIADVSHYVTENSILDKEAEKRGTSVYLVDRTFPMLPEKLSNGVCSLRPQEEKLTFSVIFTINSAAKIEAYRIAKTVIFSDKRFSYEEAQEILEQEPGSKAPYAYELHTLNRLAKILKEERYKKGAINFETEEVKFRLDENGKPIELVKKIRKDAHKLIEEFMLLANKQVALHVDQFKKDKQKAVFVYRVHDEPSMEKLLDFNKFAKRFGYAINTDTRKSISNSFNKLVTDVEGKPEQHIIQSMAIRSMAKALYSTKNTGHYGLAFTHYSHFTSPIRRYPDLMAHRLLFRYMHGHIEKDMETYEVKCKHSSIQEQKAAEAERNSIKYKQAEYMSNFIGRVFPGLITGVTEWGIYVEVIENKCEGLVRLNSIFDDYYEFVEREQAVVGKRYKKRFMIGDQVKVKVKNASPQKMAIDYILV